MVKKIGDVNKYIAADNAERLVHSAENFHSNQYNDIVNMLINENRNSKLVCIAGPSSSGKTIFSDKLRHRLLDVGIDSFVVSMDNYFCDKVDIPADADGQYDFESIAVVEVGLFNRQLEDLAAGKYVYMPKYNFFTGKKEYDTVPVSVDRNTVIFVEGIHALNYSVLFPDLSREQLFGVYITPRDTYEAENGKTIKPHQVRLIRRIVRDMHYRNCDIMSTLKMWASVRAGEHKYIKPTKQNADYQFNSALKYELPVLKDYFIQEYNKMDGEAQELCETYLHKKTLEEFLSISAEMVPQASILNEFIPKIC